MPLNITRQDDQGIEILALKGDLTFGQEDLDFRKELNRLIDAGRTKVLCNLTHLTQLDETGLATLLFAREKLLSAGGNLAVFTSEPLEFDPVIEARLTREVKVFETKQDAIDTFFPGTETRGYDVLELVQSFKAKGQKLLGNP